MQMGVGCERCNKKISIKMSKQNIFYTFYLNRYTFYESLFLAAIFSTPIISRFSVASVNIFACFALENSNHSFLCCAQKKFTIP